MTMNISQRDWEALSAFLDGQLDPGERVRMERSLQERVDFRNALEELRQTRAMLRSTPRLRAPRNFMLKADMVAARPALRSPFSWFPTLRLTSALASLMFIFVLLGEFLAAGRPAASLMASQPAAEVALMQESAPLAEASAAEVPPEAAAKMAPEASTEAPALAAAPAEAAATNELMAAEAMTDTESNYPTPTQDAGISAMRVGEGAVPEAGGVITASAETGLAMAPNPDGTYPSVELSAKIAPEAADVLIQQPMALLPEHAPFWSLWRVAETLLALLALTAGILALYLWRIGRA